MLRVVTCCPLKYRAILANKSCEKLRQLASIRTFCDDQSGNIAETLPRKSDKEIEEEIRRLSQGDLIEQKTLKQAVDDFYKPEVKADTLQISTDKPEDVHTCSGVPEEHIYERKVRIFVPAKNAMQSGWNNTRAWTIEWDNRERWENPLIGWTSTADPLSNTSMAMTFPTKESAIAYVEKMAYPYWVDEDVKRTVKPKAYADNFSWNKRCRVQTK